MRTLENVTLLILLCVEAYRIREIGPRCQPFDLDQRLLPMVTLISSWSVFQACLFQIIDFGLRFVLFPFSVLLAFPIMHLISHLPSDLVVSRSQSLRQCRSMLQLPTFGALGTVELASLTVLVYSADGFGILLHDEIRTILTLILPYLKYRLCRLANSVMMMNMYLSALMTSSL